MGIEKVNILFNGTKFITNRVLPLRIVGYPLRSWCHRVAREDGAQEPGSAYKAKGTKFGRPQAQRSGDWDSVSKDYKEGKLMAPKAIERLGMGKTTFFKILKTG